jgi:hypothetical protein
VSQANKKIDWGFWIVLIGLILMPVGAPWLKSLPKCYLLLFFAAFIASTPIVIFAKDFDFYRKRGFDRTELPPSYSQFGEGDGSSYDPNGPFMPKKWEWAYLSAFLFVSLALIVSFFLFC